MSVKAKIQTLLEQLNTGIYEKEEVMALALLSSIAGESIFLLGPPGVAKSLNSIDTISIFTIFHLFDRYFYFCGYPQSNILIMTHFAKFH